MAVNFTLKDLFLKKLSRIQDVGNLQEPIYSGKKQEIQDIEDGYKTCRRNLRSGGKTEYKVNVEKL
jgi:hypothetical protein